MTLAKFPQKTGFYKTLKLRVDEYFAQEKLHYHGNWQIFLKTGIILTGYITCYISLVFFTHNIWAALFIGFLLSQFYVMIGFNIQHDANHNSYSKHSWLNKLGSLSLDFVGGSSELWKQAHNFLHHTYTNIDNIDADMETLSLLRLNPHQEWKPWHRFQHLYFVFVYAILLFYWIYLSDFQKLISGKIGDYKLPNLGYKRLTILFSFKAFYIFYALILPCFFHPIYHVIIANLLILGMVGFNLSIIFNLAHIMNKNEFPITQGQYLQDEWAIHQVKTTANFATNNWFLTWYLGGLNFQIEHHIFPRMSHIHYPNIHHIVKKTCEEFNIDYINYGTIGEAVIEHINYLQMLGKSELAVNNQQLTVSN